MEAGIAIVDAMGKAGGIRVGDFTYLVPGDFSEWVLFVSEHGGDPHNNCRVYSLSAFDGGVAGLHPMIRNLCKSHLVAHLEYLGIEPPPRLRDREREC